MSTVDSPAALPQHSDERGTELVARARVRARLGLTGREGLIAILLAGSFLAAAISGAVFLPSVRPFSPAAAVIALVAYAGISRVRFEVSYFWLVPTQLVLVPMLFTLPPRIVPLVVAAGLILGKTP